MPHPLYHTQSHTHSPEGDDFICSSVQSSHQQGQVVGFRATVCEVHHFQVTGHSGHQLLRKFLHGRSHVDTGGVPETLQLVLKAAKHFAERTIEDTRGLLL